MATLQPLHNCQGHQVWFPVSSVVGVVGLEEAMTAMATLAFPSPSRGWITFFDIHTRRRKLPCLVSHSDRRDMIDRPNDEPSKMKQAHITPPAFLRKTKQKRHAIRNHTRSVA
jgi:hypothetical protein